MREGEEDEYIDEPMVTSAQFAIVCRRMLVMSHLKGAASRGCMGMACD